MPKTFEWVHIIPGIKALPAHLSHTIIVMLILVPLVWVVGKKLRSVDLDVVPPKRFGALAFFEMVYEAILDLATGILGHHAPQFMYLIAGLAIYILFSNLLGVIPGLAPPTDNVNTTAACALTVFFASHYYGFKSQGVSYLKHFAGPVSWLAPLMIPIEIIGHLARPLSLTLRLFGNMFGDHIVLTVFTSMSIGLTTLLLKGNIVLKFFTPISVLIPFVVIILGIFVAVVQTLVFILLTMSYLAGSVSDHH